MSDQTPIGIGLIGLGTVGQGVVKLLQEQKLGYAQRVGRPFALRQVLVRDVKKIRDVALPAGCKLTSDPEAFFADSGISIVAEVAGGRDPVGRHVRRALESGRHVVTANKSLLAAEGAELFSLARRCKVSISFEASCAAAIPILASLKFGLAASRIDAVYGILNGTCNYILTQMAEHGAAYDDVLAEAQKLGYAEADPTLDVSGADAAQKLAIVASLAFGLCVSEPQVACRGIDTLDLEDVRYGAELGYQIKLLAIARRRDQAIELGVQPGFIDRRHPLAQVRGAFNAISVFGSASGHAMFYGNGAGQMPTAGAVVSDLINVAGGWYPQAFSSLRLWPDQQAPAQIVPPDQSRNRFYLRVRVKDRPGVMAQVTHILGDLGISISAVLQREGEDKDYVPIIITTHQAATGDVNQAAERIAALDSAGGAPVCIPIIDLPKN